MDAGFRVRGGGGGASGVSRISARRVLKVRPQTKSGGGSPLQVRYKKSGGGGGGGGGNQSASGPIPLIVWHTENICMYYLRTT